MKKLILITLILVPFLSFGQKRINKVPLKNFLNTYSEYNGYDYLEVTEGMFNQLRKQDGIDKEMENFLSKLKFIRFLEYKPSRIVKTGTGITPVTVVGHSTGDTRYVNGMRLRKDSTLNPYNIKVDSLAKSTGNRIQGVTTTVRRGSNSVGYSTDVLVQNNRLYDNVASRVSLGDYERLMKSNQNNVKLLFLTKITNGYHEYVLINGNTLIHIYGSLEISHIDQVEEILEAVGEILPI